jgi:hypothetical protein
VGAFSVDRREIGSPEERARHYRMRAAEIRAIVDTMTSRDGKAILLQVVQEYEQLARSYEAQGAKPDGHGR